MKSEDIAEAERDPPGRISAFLIIVVISLFSISTSAEIPIVEGEDGNLSIGAFASNFTLGNHLNYDTAGLVPENSATNAALVRFETRANYKTFNLEVHNRFFWRASSSDLSGGFGLGATQPPKRTVDLRSELITEDQFSLEHDLDRAALTWFTPVGDATVGRQAITWGNNVLFPVADLWTQFSPFEVDTSQKRGVDGLRLLAYPWGLELDAVVVDRGELEDLSGGVRLAWSLGTADYFGGFARNFETFHALMGMTYEFDSFRTHGALQIPFDPEEGDLILPRGTIGIDYFSTDLTAILEYHFNGYGIETDADYLTAQNNERVLRGEAYLNARHYVGGVVTYLPIPELSLTASTIFNVVDPSAIITPTLSYTLSDNTSFALGGYFGIGETPMILPLPSIPSEFGAAGFSGFMQLSGFL